MIQNKSKTDRRAEAGFTLMEACIATLILSIGIMGVANLSVVATVNNANANQTTAAAFLATQKLEELRATPYADLVDSPADSLDTDQANFNATVDLGGTSGSYRIRWEVTTVGSGLPPMRFLKVRAENRGPRGRLTRAEFSTFRTCSLGPTAGCP